MKLSIVSPEETLYEGEVKSVKMQGIDGKFQVLNDHAPLISALSKGEIKIIEEESGEEKVFAINSGLVELAKNEIHILAQ
jgi:F-type H+-transporting ATPase subunit epsilon